MHAGTANHSGTDLINEVDHQPRRGRAALAVAGSAAVVVGGGAVGMSPADAQQGEPETCLESLASDLTEPEDWAGFFEACQAEFGGVKVLVDVITDDGSPLPDDLDLDGIAQSMGFSYGSAALDEASVLVPESYYQGGMSYYEVLCIFGPVESCDTLGGASYGAHVLYDPTSGDVPPMEDNEFVVFLTGLQPPASVGTGGIGDVGGRWELAATSFSPDFASAWSGFPDDDGDSDVVYATLELTQAPEPTTTTAAPTTTEATTTTAADVGAEDVVPAPTLPATGSSDSTGILAWFGAALAAVGLGTVATVRRATRRV